MSAQKRTPAEVIREISSIDSTSVETLAFRAILQTMPEWHELIRRSKERFEQEEITEQHKAAKP